MELKQKKQVLATKRVDQVPFKSELYSHDVSGQLIMAAGNKKTYREFIRDCDNPDLLHEVLMFKRNDSHFPDVSKIRRIAFYAATAAALTAIFKGKEMASKISCSVYRTFMPKKQYSENVQ